MGGVSCGWTWGGWVCVWVCGFVGGEWRVCMLVDESEDKSGLSLFLLFAGVP